MEFSGHIAEDAPDPWDEVRGRVAALGLTAAGLVQQPHLEDRGVQGISESRHQEVGGPEVVEEVSLSRSYTLWRNPDDRDDPANLADLDDALRASLDRAPDRPLPAWLLEERRRMRFPVLWEAVQTHWTADGVEVRSAADRLITHAEYVLHNRFRAELGLEEGAAWRSLVSPRALQPSRLEVDGEPRPSLLLDTDPFVLALGVALDDGRVVTVVLPRDELRLIDVALRSSAPVTPEAAG
jgi:hypothetical protein